MHGGPSRAASSFAQKKLTLRSRPRPPAALVFVDAADADSRCPTGDPGRPKTYDRSQIIRLLSCARNPTRILSGLHLFRTASPSLRAHSCLGVSTQSGRFFKLFRLEHGRMMFDGCWCGRASSWNMCARSMGRARAQRHEVRSSPARRRGRHDTHGYTCTP